ncbi:MAG TPA: hypothetical protein PLK34_03115, partial [Candidatus Pacearchaeota archaeon]|nr:hypothetical protein [Candidatus Pacearchaeota archaeon]
MTNQSFKIEIEDIPKIYAKLKQKNNFSLGRVILEDPFEEAFTEVSNLGGTEWSSSTLLEVSKGKIKIPARTLEGKFNAKIIRDTAYILDEFGRPKYEIHAPEDSLSSEFYILFGTSGEDLFDGCNTPTKPLSSLENFVKQFTEYQDLVETVVNGIYHEGHFHPQNNVMYWKYTGRTLDMENDEEGKLYDIEEKIPEIQTEKPNVLFEDVGGQEKAKEEVKWLSHGLTNPEMYHNWGII